MKVNYRYPRLFRGHNGLRLLAAASIFSLLGACTPVRLVAVYDQEIDKNVTALQKKVDGFLVKLRTLDGLPECTYSAHKSMYPKLDVDVTAIQVRAAAIPQNRLTSEQIKEVKGILFDLESLHRLRESGYAKKSVNSPCIPIAALDKFRSLTNTAFTNVLALELAKRRGEK
jgi:hypothetical protein